MEAVYCSSPGGRGEGRPQGNTGCKIIRASWTIKVKIREERMVQEASRPAWAVVTGPQVDPVGGREREAQEEVTRHSGLNASLVPGLAKEASHPGLSVAESREGAGLEYPPLPLVKFLGSSEPMTLLRRSNTQRDA